MSECTLALHHNRLSPTASEPMIVTYHRTTNQITPNLNQVVRMVPQSTTTAVPALFGSILTNWFKIQDSIQSFLADSRQVGKYIDSNGLILEISAIHPNAYCRFRFIVVSFYPQQNRRNLAFCANFRILQTVPSCCSQLSKGRLTKFYQPTNGMTTDFLVSYDPSPGRETIPYPQDS